MVTYTIKSGVAGYGSDVLLCDVNSTISGSTLTIPTWSGYSGGLCFNFHPGEDVQKTIDKTIYVIQKPGVPTGYEIGLGERLFTITTTLKSSTSSYSDGIFRSLVDLNYLANYQYDKLYTVGGANRSSYGIINFYYNGDGYRSAFYGENGFIPVMVKNLWYQQRSGGSMFDLRISLSEVSMP